MILVETNIIMYATGAPLANKRPSVRLLERIASDEFDASINTETLLEIPHRHRSIERWYDGRQVYDLARPIFPAVISVTAEHLDHARKLLDEYPGVMARDPLHAALLIDEKFESIYSYDRDFDKIAGARRARRVPP